MRAYATLLFLVLAITTRIAGAVPCPEPKLEALAGTSPKCQFYRGTRHYRAKRYLGAFNQWKAIVDAPNIPKKFKSLRLDAQNNLGYLYYMGLGVKKDKERAIQQYWLPAEKAGHEEAAYHLCHAYADDSPALALGYCHEALRRYDRLGETDEDNSEVIDQVREKISQLKAKGMPDKSLESTRISRRLLTAQPER